MTEESKALVKWDEKYAEAAEQYASAEQSSGGTFISVKGGVFTFGDEQIGTEMAVIVLDSVHENTFYEGRYEEGGRNAPKCYAFSRDGKDMEPHESMQKHPEYFEVQSPTGACLGCPQNEWGSADTGKGKACQNRRRLALINAGFYERRKGSKDTDLKLIDDPKHFKSSDIAFIKLPVMSAKEWSNYVTQITSSSRLPPFGVITRMHIVPDPKSQYRIKFEMVEQVPDDIAEIIFDRHEQAKASIVTGYSPPEEREAPAKGVNRLKGRK